ncbi:hypothetical protein [Meiothermus cerbereus]|uniref:hypothetical protein n=1 Tax=Meiothermus cerbereus TaxID=65552 RepID=UPI003EEB7703
MDLAAGIINFVDGIVNRDVRKEQAEAAEAQAKLEIERHRQATEQARLEAEKTKQMMLYGVAIITVGFVAYKMLGR